MTLYFSSVSGFLDMNGYAPYVWPAWGVVLGLLLIQAFMAKRERRRILADIRRTERRRKAQQQADV